MAIGDTFSGSNPFEFSVQQTLQAPQQQQQQAPAQPYVPEMYGQQFTGRGGKAFDVNAQGQRVGSEQQWISPTGETWYGGRPQNAMVGAGGQLQDKDWNWYEQNYGLDQSRWNPEGVMPWEMSPRTNATVGLERHAMRNLGFDQDFGGGTGGAFRNQVGQGAINTEIDRIIGQRHGDQQQLLRDPSPAQQQAPLDTGYLWDQTFTGLGGQEWGTDATGQRVDEFNRPQNTWVSPSGELWNTDTNQPMNAVVGEGGQIVDKNWDFYQQTYGVDPTRWNPSGVQPWENDQRFDAEYGVSRGAMRNLGFEGDFGGGRGSAFIDEVGKDAVQAEVDKMTAGRLAEQQSQAATVGTARDMDYGGGFQGTQFPDWLAQNPVAGQNFQDLMGGAKVPLGIGAQAPGQPGMGMGMGGPLGGGMGAPLPSDPLSGNYSLEQDMGQFIPYMEAYKPAEVPQHDSLSDLMNRGETGYIGGYGDRADMVNKDNLKAALDEIMGEWEAKNIGNDGPFKQIEGKPGWWPQDTTWFD